MIYPLKMVIFHGYVSHNQRVMDVDSAKYAMNHRPIDPSPHGMLIPYGTARRVLFSDTVIISVRN